MKLEMQVELVLLNKTLLADMTDKRSFFEVELNMLVQVSFQPTCIMEETIHKLNQSLI